MVPQRPRLCLHRGGQADARPAAFGLLYLAINFGAAVAPIVGGLLASANYALLFWVDAATSLAYASVIAIAIPETLGKRDLGGRVTLGVKEVLRHKPGAVSMLVPPHDEIHAMYNPTKRDTVEIHVYGKDLAGLQRHTFGEDGTVKSLVSSKYMNC